MFSYSLHSSRRSGSAGDTPPPVSDRIRFVIGVFVIISLFISVAASAQLSQRSSLIGDAGRDSLALLESSYPRVNRKFSASFPQAANVRWMRDGSDLYFSFLKEGKKSTCVFTTGGKMHYCITYLVQQDLPGPVATRLRYAYPDHSIFNVKEILFERSLVYYVVLQGKKDFVTVSVSAGEMEEVGRMGKAE